MKSDSKPPKKNPAPVRIEYQQEGRWQQEPGEYPSMAAARKAAREGAQGRHWRVVSVPNPAAVALGRLGGAAATKKQAVASRRNGKRGGRPKGPQPWLALGISRQTWYARKRKEKHRGED